MTNPGPGGESAARAPLVAMVTYILQTPASPDRLLQAGGLAELSELVDCALHAGDRIDRLAAVDPHSGRVRPLEHSETRQLLLLLGG